MSEVKKKHGKIKVMTFSHYKELYGANRSLLTLMLASRNEIDWLVICRQSGYFTEELTKFGIPFEVVPFKVDVYNEPVKFSFLRGLLKLINNTYYAIYLASLVTRSKISVIHSNTSVILIGALTSFFARKPHVWHFREFVFEDYKSKYNLGKSFFHFWVKKAKLIICISQSVLKARITDHKIVTNTAVIYNGLVDENSEIQPREFTRAVPVLTIMGVINPAKNQLVAVQAVAHLLKKGRVTKLKIAGDINMPEYYQEIVSYIESENIAGHVEFLGFVKDISPVLQSTDVALMCSHHEAFGRVTIESMIAGVPVVAYNSAGSTEIIEHEKNGLLYQGDAKALADQLERLFSDPALYNRISTNALQDVKNRFTIKSYADNFTKEISNCLAHA